MQSKTCHKNSGCANVTVGGPPAVMKKHSVVVANHPTSITLEQAFWQAFKEVAARRGTTINKLTTEIDRHRHSNLSSAIRVFILEEFRAKR